MSYILDAFLQTVQEAASSAAVNYISSVNPIAAIARAGSLSGLSATRTLAAFRQAGGHIADSTWYQVWRGVASSANPGDLLSSLLNGDLSGIRNVAGGRAGVYQLDFQVHTYHVTGTGDIEYGTRTFSILQRNFDLENASLAMNNIISNIQDPEGESGKWLGWELQRVTQYTGK